MKVLPSIQKVYYQFIFGERLKFFGSMMPFWRINDPMAVDYNIAGGGGGAGGGIGTSSHRTRVANANLGFQIHRKPKTLMHV